MLGVLLQGASAAGVSLWTSLKGTVIEATLESRFGSGVGPARDRLAALGALLLAGEVDAAATSSLNAIT